ncbi:MAG TPA: tRNA pseudouridine(55) synthase TruB [Candidatus Enterocloster faecavium]|uniref:tRNA pseudouridine synthase B n=1 Tax=Candidatus Enterocloster faecavium TaxID=2838560 RepID=A0A9D2LA39_9FIRM|nr:tRNA pseudouridine(55) synthase TruB [Candidatus Enterocloster faecavium]
MYHGMINVYKEPGYTSHDVVARLRGILKQKKIGHTGTLDPAAQGVLPVCLGVGTRLCELLTDRDKTYEAVLLLGQETDTQDTTGQILKEDRKKAMALEEEEIRRAAGRFIGLYQQIPPMYSALKVQGKKLYELARQGKTVEREARPVTIYQLEIQDITLPRVTLKVSCSKGTYIRTLCHDIGQALGCGGCMEQLTRTRAAGFRIEDSLKLDEIEELAHEGRIEERIIPVEEALTDYPALAVRPEWDGLVHNGNPCFARQLDLEDGEQRKPEDGALFRMYDSQGKLMGIYEYEKERHFWKPKKMLLA